MIFISYERAYATSYYWLIVTLAVDYLTVIYGQFPIEFRTLPLFNPQYENVPLA